MDTATQREWLDLSKSSTFTYSQINAGLGTGGQFDGYHLASLGDIGTFIINSGIFGPFSGPNAGTEAFNAFNDLVTLLGTNSADISGDGCTLTVKGATGDMARADAVVGGFTNTRGGGSDCMTQTPAMSTNGFYGPNFLSSADFMTPLADVPLGLSGAWLFRDVAAVSAPGTLALVSLGLLGLIRVGRRGMLSKSAA